MRQLFAITFAATIALTPLTAQAYEIGRVGVDWVGNDILIEAIPDPKVEGVTCHISYFERSMWDRLTKGNWLFSPRGFKRNPKKYQNKNLKKQLK